MGISTFGSFKKFTIASVNTSKAPVWNTPEGPLAFGFENDAYTTTLVATDPKGRPLTYAIATGALPVGLFLDSSTGVISGTLPAVMADFVYNFTASATFDDTNFAFRSFSIEVRNVNVAPVWQTPAGSIGSILEARPFNFKFVATDADGDTITYTLSNSTSLPSGLTLNSAGYLTGTAPSVNADTTTNFTVRASDPKGAADYRSFSITVANEVINSAPVFSTAATLTPVNERGVWNQPITALYANTYALVSGTLPSGTTFNAANGVLTGTMPSVTADTNYNFRIVANNAVGSTPRDFTVTVKNVPTTPVWVTGGSLPSAMEGSNVSIQLVATDVENRTITYTRETYVGAPQPPAGLTMNANGVLTGRPYAVNANTTSTFVIRAYNADGYTPQSFSMTILNNPSLPVWDTNTGVIYTGNEGTAFGTIPVAAHDSLNRTITYRLDAVTNGSLGGNMAFSTNGYFYGTLPRVIANTNIDVVISAVNPDGSVPRNFTIVNNNVPTAPIWNTGNTNPIGTPFEGGSINVGVSASGIDGAPVTYSVVSGSLPDGIELNTTTGAVTGTAPRVGVTTSFPFVIRASTADGAYADRSFSILVNNSVQAPVWFTDAGFIGAYYEKSPVTFNFSATHPDLPVFYRVANGTSLPGTLTLNANTGAVTGNTPATDGGLVANISLQAYNSDGATAVRNWTFTVYDQGGGPVWQTPAGSLGTGDERSAFSTTLSATDAGGYPVTYSVISGTLPSTLTLNANTGVISGTYPTVTANTTTNITVRAQTEDGHADRAFSITTINVGAAPTWVTDSALLTANEATAVNTVVVAQGADNTVVTYSNVGAMPGSMTVNSVTGRITGNLPRVLNTSDVTFTIRANSAEGFADRTFTANVVNVPVAPNWTTANGVVYSAQGGNAISTPLVASHIDNAAITYSLAANSGALPSGVTLNSNGVLTGILPVVGSDTNYPFVANATAEGIANTRAFRITSLAIAANTTILLNMESDTANGTTLTDSSQYLNTMSLGNTVVTTARAKYGTRSLGGIGLRNGFWSATNQPARCNTNSARVAANQDYTIEFWFYMISQYVSNFDLVGNQYTSSFITLYNTNTDSNGRGNDTFYIGTNPQASSGAPTGLKLHVGAGYDNGAAYSTVVSAGTMAFNTWHHVAVVRQSNVHKVYVNGASKTLSTTVDNTQTQGFGNSASDVWQFGGNTYQYQGQYATNGLGLNGYMDDIRFSKIARYTTNFTPTGPLGND